MGDTIRVFDPRSQEVNPRSQEKLFIGEQVQAENPSDFEVLTELGLFPKLQDEVPLKRLNTIALRG